MTYNEIKRRLIKCEKTLALFQQKDLSNSTPERVTDVSWAADVQTSYALTIRIEANDRPALMRDISSVLANEKINVLIVVYCIDL